MKRKRKHPSAKHTHKYTRKRLLDFIHITYCGYYTTDFLDERKKCWISTSVLILNTATRIDIFKVKVKAVVHNE